LVVPNNLVTFASLTSHLTFTLIMTTFLSIVGILLLVFIVFALLPTKITMDLMVALGGSDSEDLEESSEYDKDIVPVNGYLVVEPLDEKIPGLRSGPIIIPKTFGVEISRGVVADCPKYLTEEFSFDPAGRLAYYPQNKALVLELDGKYVTLVDYSDVILFKKTV